MLREDEHTIRQNNKIKNYVNIVCWVVHIDQMFPKPINLTMILTKFYIHIIYNIVDTSLFIFTKEVNKNVLQCLIGTSPDACSSTQKSRGWSGGAMVLGKLSVPGRPTIGITVGQGPTALAVGAGGGCLDIFSLIYPFSSLSPSLWEMARYRLKYCLKGPLNPKQPTNQKIRNPGPGCSKHR